jgi:hypothetical protein
MIDNQTIGFIFVKNRKMKKFKAFFCDPTEPEIIDLGDMAQDTIIDYFEKIDWNEYLQKSRNAKLDEIYYYPTFEVKNQESKNRLSISAIGVPDNYKFKIIYKRPKKVKSFFGLNNQIIDNYSSIENQTKNDVYDCLKAILRDDTVYLTNKVGQ